jgi:hypothetical protein
VTFLLVNPPHSNEKKKGQNQKKGVRRETSTLRIVAQRAYIVCRVVVSPLTSFHRHNQHTDTHTRRVDSSILPSLLCFRNKLDSWMRERVRSKDTQTHKSLLRSSYASERLSLSLSRVCPVWRN